ncbi:MAG: hypothetical protein FJ349_02795 [Sphingomonadales bacterium]|nr:hypothetical protein [Sphingomonadales bacterium]
MKAIALLLFLPFLSFAQDIPKKDQLKAKRITANAITLFNEGQSSNAYMLLKQAVAIDPNNGNAFYWLANTEFDLRSYFYAQEHMQKAITQLGSGLNADDLYLAVQIELSLGQLQSANQLIERAKKMLNSNKNFQALGFDLLEKQCLYALQEQQKGIGNQRILLGGALNTKYDEYGPILSADGLTLYFTSRNPDAKGANLNPDDQRFFEDIYQAQRDPLSDTLWMRIYTNDELLNTEGFDALSYVSADQKMALGTLNTTASKEGENKTMLTQSSDIFELSTELAGSWDDKRLITEIPGLNTSYFDGSPTKTDTIWIDEFTYVEELYFVSDRNSEKYATEIYCAKKINGIWQAEVKALPQGINTEGRETTPYVTPDGKFLFFASDGHAGMGGYDLFMCKRNGAEWSAPINLGAKINTTLDDTHLQLGTQYATWASVSDIDGLFSYNLFFAPIGILQTEGLK